jgi:hypothetical protein
MENREQDFLWFFQILFLMFNGAVGDGFAACTNLRISLSTNDAELRKRERHTFNNIFDLRQLSDLNLQDTRSFIIIEIESVMYAWNFYGDMEMRVGITFNNFAIH